MTRADLSLIVKPLIVIAATISTVTFLGLMGWLLVTVQDLNVSVARLDVQISALGEKITTISTHRPAGALERAGR